MLNQDFVIIGIIIGAIGSIVYLIDIAKGKVKPAEFLFCFGQKLSSLLL
jgi:hypothetical protein